MMTRIQEYTAEFDTQILETLPPPTEPWDIEPAESWSLDDFEDIFQGEHTLRPDTWN